MIDNTRVHRTPKDTPKRRCVCRGGTFAARGFGGAKAGGWVGSPAKRKGIEGWTCDDCGRFIPCTEGGN
jgi:hypothetical protein